jgi:hypothetical protein
MSSTVRGEKQATSLRVLFVYYASRCFLAGLIAIPFATALTSAGIAKRPEGDALLFSPGGTYLLEALRLGRYALDATTSMLPWYFLVASVLSLIPAGFLLFGLSHPRASIDWLTTRALDVFPRFVFLSAVALVAQALLLALVSSIAFKAQSVVTDFSTPERGDLTFTLLMLVGLPFFLWLTLLFDLARAGVVLYGHGFLESTTAAKRIVSQRPILVLMGWLEPALVASILVIATGFVVGKLRIEAGDNWRWLTAFALHQAVVFALCAAEARWLKRALGFVAVHATRETGGLR